VRRDARRVADLHRPGCNVRTNLVTGDQNVTAEPS
jgi:hypothetical protein